MIKDIEINNFILIQSAKLTLGAGFNVITGESGAGKSLLLKAIRFAFGARATKSIIGQWGKSAHVKISVDIAGHQLSSQYGAVLEIDHQLSMSKRSIKVNNKVVTLSELQKIYQLLVLDCQQSSEQLLKQQKHQQLLLDQTIDANCIKSFNTMLSKYDDLKITYTQLLNSMSMVDDLELMQYHTNELGNALDIESNIENLHEIVYQDRQLADIASKANVLSSVLSEAERKLAIFTGLEDYQDLKEQSIELKDAIDVMQEKIEALEVRQKETNMKAHAAKETLSNLGDLARKHKVPVSELPVFHKNMQEQINTIQTAIDQLPQIEQETALYKEQLMVAADILYQKRVLGAQVLQNRINQALPALGIDGMQCEINVSEAKLSYNGGSMVHIGFSVSGKPVKSVEQLSGGELSRVSLMIHAYCTKSKIMLLDEVDVGLSGEAAKKMKLFLQDLASRAQVVAISHLAQVAASAAHHIKVTKYIADHEIESRIAAIGQEDLIKEISRILSGGESEVALAHAKECIEEGVL
jgi:DNA repair protein RecN (Recombination protein N)